MLFSLQENYLLFSDSCHSGLRLWVNLTMYSPRERVTKQALRTETTAIVKGLKWAEYLLNSVKRRKRAKVESSQKEALEETDGFRGLRLTKKVKPRQNILPPKWQGRQEKFVPRIIQPQWSSFENVHVYRQSRGEELEESWGWKKHCKIEP